MSSMFYKCSSLISLPDISNWNTKKSKNIYNMFYECSSLLKLPDLSNWNINNVTNVAYKSSMIYECLSLIITLPKKFK